MRRVRKNFGKIHTIQRVALVTLIALWIFNFASFSDTPSMPGAPPQVHANPNLSEFSQSQGKSRATTELEMGLRYEKGDQVSRNEVEAVKWYRKAADHGLAEAQFNLARCYAEGRGIPLDYAESARWFQKAANPGYALTESSLGTFYANGCRALQDFAEAVMWLRKAAPQDPARAQYKLGICYFKGLGVPKDSSEAVTWFRKAAEHGYAQAKAAIVMCDVVGGKPLGEVETVKRLGEAIAQDPAILSHGGLGFDVCDVLPRDFVPVRQLGESSSDASTPGADTLPIPIEDLWFRRLALVRIQKKLLDEKEGNSPKAKEVCDQIKAIDGVYAKYVVAIFSLNGRPRPQVKGDPVITFLSAAADVAAGVKTFEDLAGEMIKEKETDILTPLLIAERFGNGTKVAWRMNPFWLKALGGDSFEDNFVDSLVSAMTLNHPNCIRYFSQLGDQADGDLAEGLVEDRLWILEKRPEVALSPVFFDSEQNHQRLESALKYDSETSRRARLRKIYDKYTSNERAQEILKWLDEAKR